MNDLTPAQIARQNQRDDQGRYAPGSSAGDESELRLDPASTRPFDGSATPEADSVFGGHHLVATDIAAGTSADSAAGESPPEMMRTGADLPRDYAIHRIVALVRDVETGAGPRPGSVVAERYASVADLHGRTFDTRTRAEAATYAFAEAGFASTTVPDGPGWRVHSYPIEAHTLGLERGDGSHRAAVTRPSVTQRLRAWAPDEPQLTTPPEQAAHRVAEVATQSGLAAVVMTDRSVDERGSSDRAWQVETVSDPQFAHTEMLWRGWEADVDEPGHYTKVCEDPELRERFLAEAWLHAPRDDRDRP